MAVRAVYVLVRGSSLIFGAIMVMAATQAAAQDKGLPALLARPMTPGSVALLVEHTKEPAAQKRLHEAIKHPDAAVRAVAARIAFVSLSKGLVPPLITAVAKEEHTPTAVEQIRALMLLLGAAGDNIVLRHVQRVGGPAAVAMAEVLGRTRRADLVRHLPELIEAAGTADTLGPTIAAAVAADSSSATAILQAVLDAKNPKLLEALVSSVRDNISGAPNEWTASEGRYDDPDTLKRLLDDMMRPSKSRPAPTQMMRTIPVFAKGLLGDLLQVTGCRAPNEETFAIGDVTYFPEGGPKSIKVVQMDMAGDCRRFVNAMMKLTIALPERPVTPEFADRIVLLFNRQYLACADDPFPPVQPRARPDSKITPPARKRQPDIMFPKAAEQHSMRGVVRLGIRLSHTGCIGSAETLRSINPVLDLASIRGVFTAKYAPGLLDGQPVEIRLIYDVSFAP